MAQEDTRRKKDEELTGRDLPDGDGTIGDEQLHAISDETDDKPTGQDHSTEGHRKTEPTSGVGAIQDENDMMSDVARVND